MLAKGVDNLEWRINGGGWRQVGHSKRNPPPRFTVEVPVQSLISGKNELELRGTAPFRSPEVKTITFQYDGNPIRLPVTTTWQKGSNLDVQDGYWEILEGARIRPVPGHEGFDRTVLVTGAIEGGRRVQTEIVFRGRAKGPRYGFGIFPLWGGQPDEEDISPRRGYRFSLLWYSNGTWGYGCEFSEKFGAEEPKWVSIYRGIDLERDKTYRLVTETWPEQMPDGRHVRWRQRCKWWPAEDPEPDQWLSISDDLGAPLPPVEYAVAVFAHNSRVEFGQVTVESLPAVTIPDQAEIE